MSEEAVLVVSGLAREAEIAAGPGVVAIAAPPAALAALISRHDGANFAAVVSFGLAGGLDPDLPVGAVVLAQRIVAAEETFVCDRVTTTLLATVLADGGLAVRRGAFAAAEGPVLRAADKRALGAARGAVAVDTESHLAAAFAARHGLPFAALRAISDPADRALPPLAVRAIGPDGRLDPRAIAAELIARPGQIAGLPGTALGAARAMRALRRVRAVLGMGFGLLG